MRRVLLGVAILAVFGVACRRKEVPANPPSSLFELKEGEKPQAISLHLGVPEVNGPSYNDWPGTCIACANDARVLYERAAAAGYHSVLLSGETRGDQFLCEVERAAELLRPGGNLLITVSLHGGAVFRDRAERIEDQTMCLFDRQVLDDELFAQWKKFAAGVRVVVLADMCYAGDIVEIASMPNNVGLLRNRRSASRHGGRIIKSIPQSVEDRLLGIDGSKRHFYECRAAQLPPQTFADIRASVFLLAAAGTEDEAVDGERSVDHGLFTSKILDSLKAGKPMVDVFGDAAKAVTEESERLHDPVVPQMPDMCDLGPKRPGFARAPLLLGRALSASEQHVDTSMGAGMRCQWGVPPPLNLVRASVADCLALPVCMPSSSTRRQYR